MVDNGYDISDYCGIDPSYGTMEDMEELIAEAKKRDIRIVMDLVYNHTSDQHPWFLESKKDRTNPKADWYIWRDAKPDGSAPTNWRAIFGGSAWTWCEERQQYYLHTFAEAQPDLNWENPEVRQALFDAANFWLDKGVGGFRIDAIVYIKKPAFKDGPVDGADGLSGIHEMTANTPGILDFLHEFRRNVFDGHDIFTVGEANGVSRRNCRSGSARTVSSRCSSSSATSSSPTRRARSGASASPGSSASSRMPCQPARLRRQKRAGIRSSSRTTTRTARCTATSQRAPTRRWQPRRWRPCSSRCAARLSSTKAKRSA